MPKEIIYALSLVKKAAATTNADLKLLSKQKAKAIIKACDEILENKLKQHFPLTIWQSGSGTQTNMNINEVIANRASKILKKPIHPNDDVNMSQSTNDTFPTAMHLASLLKLKNKLLPTTKELHKELNILSKKFNKILKVGRTHLQDAVPLTLGQEFSGYAAQIEISTKNLKNSFPFLQELAIGGTAVGTGLNAPKQFGKKVATLLSKWTKIKFKSATNKFCMSSSHEALAIASSALRTLATSLFKIANDIRLLASGPHCGLGELILPKNEPGSSIMPGKVNPTQCEVMMMVCSKVIGNDETISFANSQGDFELNIFKPVMAHSLLQSIELLANACDSFRNHTLKGIKANRKKIDEYLNNSLMTVTALNPIIGYEKSSKIVKYSLDKNISPREACLKLGFLSAKEFDALIS